tara:strand:+ start:459 stop:665 length:207 start_codon:yes stop_codon:yes gene_type:complete
MPLIKDMARQYVGDFKDSHFEIPEAWYVLDPDWTLQIQEDWADPTGIAVNLHAIINEQEILMGKLDLT